MMRISSQAVQSKKGFHVRENAKKAVFVEEFPNNLTEADWIVQNVPKVIFQIEQRIL